MRPLCREFWKDHSSLMLGQYLICECCSLCKGEHTYVWAYVIEIRWLFRFDYICEHAYMHVA